MADRFVAAVAGASIGLLRKLPLGVCFALGRVIGTVLWAVLPGYRKLAVSNIRAALGDSVNAHHLAREHFATLGANGLSALKIPALNQDEINRIARIDGLDTLHNHIAAGKGVVLAINHIGNWELYAQLIFRVPEARFGTVYQALHNKQLDELINRDRRRLGVLTFDRKRGYTGAIELLREPGILGVLVDQSAGNGGMWTPFFGRLASTSTLAATLAARADAAIVPVAISTSGFAKWHVQVGETLQTEGLGIDEVTARINRALEDQIRSTPRDWFWVHNRWKTPHPNFLTVNQKRGTYLPPDRPAASLAPFRIVARSPNWLGDAVMAIPAVRAFKLGRPDARLTVATPAKLAELWRRVEGVDEVIEIPRKASPLRVARLLRGRFDAAVLFPNSLRSGLEAWCAGIPRRVGLADRPHQFFLNQIVRERTKGKVPRPQHHSDRYAHIAIKCGGTIPPPTPPLWNPPPGRPIIGLVPGAEYGPAKRWPAAKFRATMDEISARTNCEWRILGTASDSEIAKEILQDFSGEACDLTGKTSLGELADALCGIHALLTNDTGTMHLADFLGVPLVALFGSTEPRLTGPRRPTSSVLRHHVPCSPCFLRQCPIDFRCMNSLAPEKVAGAVMAALITNGPTNA
jgi:heptosyltransferase II